MELRQEQKTNEDTSQTGVKDVRGLPPSAAARLASKIMTVWRAGFAAWLSQIRERATRTPCQIPLLCPASLHDGGGDVADETRRCRRGGGDRDGGVDRRRRC